MGSMIVHTRLLFLLLLVQGGLLRLGPPLRGQEVTPVAAQAPNSSAVQEVKPRGFWLRTLDGRPALF